MAEDDVLVEVRVRIRKGSLAVVDELACEKSVSRSEIIRQAITWLVAREARVAVRNDRIRKIKHHRGELEALRRKVAAIERSLTSDHSPS